MGGSQEGPALPGSRCRAQKAQMALGFELGKTPCAPTVPASTQHPSMSPILAEEASPGSTLSMRRLGFPVIIPKQYSIANTGVALILTGSVQVGLCECSVRIVF